MVTLVTARECTHNWTVEAKVEGNKINTIGMVIDFKDIKK